MKKIIIPLVVLVLVLIIGVSAFLIIQFTGLTSSDTPTEQESIQLEEYVQEHWPDFEAHYDAESKTLTLSQVTKLTYESACVNGSSIYSNELAPATYLPQARSIAIDLMGSCNTSGINVILSYESTDGMPIFTVNSNGETWACWEEN